MELKAIGKTGVSIPPIVFGTSALGNLYTALDRDVKLDIVRQSLQQVPTSVVFDSAGKYGAGLALEELGRCLTELNVAPEDVLISNKLGWKRVPLAGPEPTFEKGVWMDLQNDAEQDISYTGIRFCYEQGNILLGGRYKPQMLSVHDPDEYLMAAVSERDREIRLGHIIEAYRALSDLKKEGRVKAIGVGAKDWTVIREISKEVELDWVMLANSMTILQHPDELLQFMQSLADKDIAIINSAVFHAGFLIGGKFFDYRLIEPDTEQNRKLFRWREQFFALCERYKLSPAAVCVAFATTAPGVISIALNTSNPRHVASNVASVTTKVPADFWAEMKSLNLISPEYPYV